MKGGQVDMSPDEPWSLSDGDPPSAVSIPMRAGDAVVFDRRIVNSDTFLICVLSVSLTQKVSLFQVHSQPHNPLVGDGLRKAVFLGYSCALPMLRMSARPLRVRCLVSAPDRWLRPRDEMTGLDKYLDRSGPIRRQLLGAGPTGARGYTSPLPEDVPLQQWIRHHFADEGMAAADALEPITSDMLKHAAKM